MATIMIVEDDRQTNDAVSEYLKSFGHRMLSPMMVMKHYSFLSAVVLI